MGNPVPTQTRSVDPYASYNSNVVNALTRIVSNGTNCILPFDPIEIISFQSTPSLQIVVGEGKCIKDDVLIEVSTITIDPTDADFYVNPGGGYWSEDGIYYVVLEYTYVKSKPAPEAEIKLILPSQRSNPAVFNTGHLFLNAIDVTANVIIQSYDYDPDNPTVHRMLSNPGGSLPTSTYTSPIGSGLPRGIKSTDQVVVSNCSTSNMTFLLPPASGSTEHRVIHLGPSNYNTVVYAPTGDTIEGHSEITLTQQYDSVTFVSDGVNTWIEV